MIEDIAQRLADARIGGLAIDIPRLDMTTGYAIQFALSLKLGTQLGWKLGATSAGAMAFLKVDAPIRGRVFTLLRDGDTASFFGPQPIEAEPEVLLELGDDLRPRATYLGAELNRPSLADPFGRGAGAIVADNAASLALLIGPEIPLATLEAPESLTATLSAAGACTSGNAAAVLGNPLAAMEELRRQLEGDTRGLRPGDIIATGAMARAIPLPPGSTLTLDGGGWGQARFTLAP